MSALRLILLLTLAGVARAGGSYFEEKGADYRPGLPYQRALIAFDGKREILILQSAYGFPGVREQPDFAWVVPLPATARLHDVSRDWVESVFWEVDHKTAPRHYSVLFDGAPYFCLGLAVLIVIAALLQWQGRWGPAILSTLLVPAVLYACLSIFAPDRMGDRGVENRNEPTAAGTRLLLEPATDAAAPAAGDPEGQAGGAEGEGESESEGENVEEAKPPRDAISWLGAEGFAFGADDEAALRACEEKGLTYAVSVVSPTEGHRLLGQAATGFCPVIAVEFETSEIVYPFALRSDRHAAMEILLYVLAPHRVEGRENLPVKGAVPFGVRLAAPGGSYNWERITSPFDDDPILGMAWLTKLKGKLSADELRKGLALGYAPTDEEHRTTEVGWK